ncbi:MAG: peptidoglycan-binding protein [Christensenellales bacterium]
MKRLVCLLLILCIALSGVPALAVVRPASSSESLVGSRTEDAQEATSAAREDTSDDISEEEPDEDAIATYPELQRGMKGDEVSKLQARLAELGIYTHSVDGDYGKKTQAAVAEYIALLRSLGVDVAGDGSIASVKVQAILYNTGFSYYSDDIADPSDNMRALYLERMLQNLNYLDREPNTTLDSDTKESLLLLQKTHGLPETGEGDAQTLDLLTSGTAKRSDAPAPVRLAEGDKNQAVLRVQKVLIRLGLFRAPVTGRYDDATVDALAAAADFVPISDATGKTCDIPTQKRLQTAKIDPYKQDLSKSSSGDEVKRLQRRLHSLGFLPRANIGGKYHAKTVSAVKAFQGANGLSKTGAADRETQLRLYSDAAMPHPEPYRIVVSIDDQMVYAYEIGSDASLTLVREMICSTGLYDTTPTGVFTATRRANRWHRFNDYFCWAQYSYSISGDIMFHSVLYNDRNEKTLIKSSERYLGRKASHGCIRLKVEDAKWIFENCKSGTTVEIRYPSCKNGY